MIFSIIIPTFSNYKYLKCCLESIKKNSYFKHQIIVHINGYDDLTEKYLISSNIEYTKTAKNVGLCLGVNTAAKKVNTDYIMYAHDDMYFLPNWDVHLKNEIERLNNNLFYFSMTQISYNDPVKGNIQHIQFDCGKNLDNFNENLLLENFDKISFRNLQGSHWAPHVIHKSVWDNVGGFSEEFDPGFGSDPDLNLKLWKHGVRIFKGVSKSRVYHFGSLTTRKNINLNKNNGRRTFLLKWGFTVDHFVKYYLKRGQEYDGPLNEYSTNIFSFFSLLLSKFKYYIQKINE